MSKFKDHKMILERAQQSLIALKEMLQKFAITTFSRKHPEQPLINKIKFENFRVSSVSSFDFTSINYFNEFLAVAIVWFTWASIGTIEIGDPDDLSAIVSNLILQLFIQAALSILGLYIFVASVFILSARRLFRSVVLWATAFSFWEIWDAFNGAQELATALNNDFNFRLACGADGSKGLIGTLSEDPNAAAGLALFTGYDVNALNDGCNLINKIGWLPYIAIIYALAVLAGFFMACKVFPIDSLSPHKSEKS